MRSVVNLLLPGGDPRPVPVICGLLGVILEVLLA